MAKHHLAAGFTIALLAALSTQASAGTKTASMSVGVTIVDSCTVTASTPTSAPGVACSSNTVQPQVVQRTVEAPDQQEQQSTLTVVTY